MRVGADPEPPATEANGAGRPAWRVGRPAWRPGRQASRAGRQAWWAGRPAWWGWLATLPPGAVDVLLAVGLAAAVTLASLASEEPGSHASAVASYGLGIGLGGLTLLRRRWPVTILILSTGLLFAYHGADLPAIGQGWPLVVALYTCVSLGRLRAAVLIASGSVTVGAVAWLVLDPGPLLPVLAVGLREAAVAGLALAFGDAVRSRRGWVAEAQQRIRRVEHDRERETTRRIVAERMRIARELHDIAAHTLAVAGVQLNVAADTLADSPDQARSALRTAQQANREAVAELKAAVRVLRQEPDDGPPRSPTPGLDGVGRLLEAAREAGLRVDFQQSGQARPLPAPAGLAVYRVIQESITNVLRHAHATTVQVQVAYHLAGLSVRILDNGSGPPQPPAVPDGEDEPGHGLIGMRERLLGLGGSFAAGRSRDGGFAVEASIPTETVS